LFNDKGRFQCYQVIFLDLFKKSMLNSYFIFLLANLIGLYFLLFLVALLYI
jgi:hypothetical protein